MKDFSGDATVKELGNQYALSLDEESPMGVSVKNNTTNVVTEEKLRAIQSRTLREAKAYLSKTFGPMGSNTKIIKGTNQENISSSYSKDGLKVLENIKNSAPIEASIIEELIEIARHVEKEVGDGTTSTVILSSYIFDYLMLIKDKYKIPPYRLIDKFMDAVNQIKCYIKRNGITDITPNHIYMIALICTNGNEDVADNLRYIYETYGNDVDITVGISNDTDTKIKVYDGLTITEGMADPCFINDREKNICEIRDARVYYFEDPIDTFEMVSLFEAILQKNLFEKARANQPYIPTVIVCPRISKDTSAVMKTLATVMYQCDTNEMVAAKPPILIVTDVVGSDEVIMSDIAHLCGCKSIKKYLDPKLLERDQEQGLAPTVDTVAEFYGKAQSVIADSKKTKFINPEHMIADVNGENDDIYTSLINFLETELKNLKGDETAVEIGMLKKRLSALKANSVDYLVGGVTIADRDAEKDLIEDAVKNCRSAAKYGVGYAANYEGLLASTKYFEKMLLIAENNNDTDYLVQRDIAFCIMQAYINITELLYSTVESDPEVVKEAVGKSIFITKQPQNIGDGRLNGAIDMPVLCTIELDQQILDTIGKIITIMVTCNQCLLQASNINNY